MNPEVRRLLAQIDQTRSDLRAILRRMSADDLTTLIKICAAKRFDDLDDDAQRVVGLLAIVAILELRADTGDSDS